MQPGGRDISHPPGNRIHPDVESLLVKLDPHRANLCRGFRKLVFSLSPDIEESPKYRIPFYCFHGMFCYLDPKRDGRLVLGVCSGAALQPRHPRLTGTGKVVRHWALTSMEDLEDPALRDLLLDALELHALRAEERQSRKKRRSQRP